MVQYLFIFNLIVFLTTPQQQVKQISYIPMGDMDKPMPEIIIKNENCEDEYDCFFLKKKDIDSLEGFLLKSYLFEKEFAVCDPFPFGAYVVIIESKNSKKQFILNNSKESFDFYTKQLPLFQEEKELSERIQTLVSRLR